MRTTSFKVTPQNGRMRNRFSISVPLELLQEINKAAIEADLDRSTWCRHGLRKHLDAKKEKEKERKN